MNVKVVDFLSETAAADFTASLKDTGFAVLRNHPVPEALIEGTYKDWREFFEGDTKRKYLFSKDKQDGYFPFGTENAKDAPLKDLKEFYHIYTWGRFPKELGGRTMLLFRELNELAITLLSWIESNLPPEISRGFSIPLRDMITDSPRTLLRTIYYPALTGDEEPGAIRAAAHEDINLITVLIGATQSGLQAQDLDGKWHDVPLDRDMIAVNTGDMLQMASGGYLPSTTHQVINPVGADRSEPRLSMPLFLHPRNEVALSDTHTADSYLKERLLEIGLM